MSLAVRALGAVLALLALLFPWPATAAAAGAPAGGTHHVYSYDAPSYPWENDTAPERGPPVEGYANTIYDALGFCSLGNSERSSGFRARATYNYDDVALLVESDILAGATTALAAKASGALSTPAAGDVAANTGSAIVKVGDFGSTSSAFSHYSKHVKGVVLGKNGSATVRAGGPDMPEFANFSQYRAAARDFMGGVVARVSSNAVEARISCALTRALATLACARRTARSGPFSAQTVIRSRTSGVCNESARRVCCGSRRSGPAHDMGPGAVHRSMAGVRC